MIVHLVELDDTIHFVFVLVPDVHCVLLVDRHLPIGMLVCSVWLWHVQLDTVPDTGGSIGNSFLSIIPLRA